ncbi:hypothetical protein AMECASPLE_031226 [Ameca splendens]|uniref:Uncharacterized protein n=2 Tax=Goodeidae TaxID=28758 RepID=A0ABV1ACN4_9TELE
MPDNRVTFILCFFVQFHTDALPLLAGALPSSVLPRQAVRPWTKDLSLYEEYKLRRNELRRRNLNRRRELEKSLPQPLLADLVRERREKTRLRVARWRAKRKLQACLNQTQVRGDMLGLSRLLSVLKHQSSYTAFINMDFFIQFPDLDVYRKIFTLTVLNLIDNLANMISQLIFS